MELFIKDRIITDDILEDILYDLNSKPGYLSSVEGDIDKIYYVDQVRNSISKRLKVNEFIDFANKIELICEKKFNSYFLVKEFEYLKYSEGSHFKKHQDTFPNKNPKKVRRYTSITYLRKSSDLEGGELFLYDNDNPISANLNVGETIIFPSHIMHSVSKIIKGNREVLVGWIYDR